MAAISGVVFYEGPSEIDGSPIVGVATFGTRNEKTGDLVQTWILRSDIHPIEAINTGKDESICGSCPLRGVIRPASERSTPSIANEKMEYDTVNKGRSCYVLVQNAPLAVYRSYKAGKYPKLSEEHRRKMMGKGLRYGSYGDPVAIPFSNWDDLAQYCTGKAEPGYTHLWKDPRFAAWSQKIMASTHSLAENELAHSMGWRTFRTVTDVAQISPLEIICPASEAGGYTANCATCGACNGRRNMEDHRKSVIIVAHGGDGKLELVRQVIEKAA
jgi:hypothetical protein